MTEIRDELRELRARVDDLERQFEQLRTENATLRGLRQLPQAAPEDPDLDQEWLADLAALRQHARHDAEDMGYLPESLEGQWLVHEFLVGGAFALAERKSPEVKPLKIPAPAIQALRELVIWAVMIETGEVQAKSNPEWRWIGFDRLAQKIGGAEGTARRVVKHLEAIRLIRFVRGYRLRQVQAIQQGHGKDRVPDGPIRHVEIAWSKVGIHPGARPPEIRERHQRFARILDSLDRSEPARHG